MLSLGRILDEFVRRVSTPFDRNLLIEIVALI
jgi:hypothetical protein